MHLFAAVSAIVIGAAAAAELETSQDRLEFLDLPESPAYIDVVEINKAYNVKLECIDCPFAKRESDLEAVWQEPQPENALLLHFTIDPEYYPEPAVLLNGRAIFPIELIPPFISALQIPSNVTWADLNLTESDPYTRGVQLPLEYEHTLMPTPEPGQYWVVFDVTGLALGEINDTRYPNLASRPTKMYSEEQKLVQMIVQERTVMGTVELFIDYIVVVERADRMEPWETEDGQLAMDQTSYNPSEWDEYGKYGTWARVQSIVKGVLGDMWLDWLEQDPLIFSLIVPISCSLFLLLFWYQRWQHVNLAVEDDEVASMSSVDKDKL